MVLDTSLFNTQQYKVSIKSKVGQSWERSCTLSYASMQQLLQREPSGRPRPRSLTYLIIFTNPSALAGYDTKSIFKLSLRGFNSEFSFSQASCLTKAEEHSLPYYLPIAGGRIIGFILFPRVLVLREMQSVSSQI